MIKRSGIFIILLAAIVVFSGCMCGQGNLDENWGRSFALAKYNQNLNPEAGKNLKPVEGLNGEAADVIMNGYKKSFAGQKEQPSSGATSMGSAAGTSVMGGGQSQPY